MFQREIIQELEKWLKNTIRKPLVIRGARQTGKTTLVNQFAEKFKHYIYLNLDLPEDRKPFEDFTTIEVLIQTLFFQNNITIDKKKETLLFIDEIQSFPAALNLLRYFHEQEPEIPVIAAGSMLETLFDEKIHFPVGRVEYKVIRPVSFPEFLMAIGETAAKDALEKIPVADFAHDKLLMLFHTYSLVGGMPEVVNNYVLNKDITTLKPIYDSLLATYLEDVEKYAKSGSQVNILRHVINASFLEAGKRIKYQGFGKSDYRSREVGEALRMLEKAMLIHLIFPLTNVELPLMQDMRKSPRLQVLDTGLLNYTVGIQKEIIGTKDLNDVYKGIMLEHLVGQELLATQYQALCRLHFWVREKKTSMAEIDYIFPCNSKLIPIEVKSGTEGKLRSLHLFMDAAPHNLALRFYSGTFSITKAVTMNGKSYTLLNLPYYLASQTEKYISWMEKQELSSKK